ncbi:MAG TPA: FKBP-type peptidyl-prolyl cis-trans isomerase [Gammaproteobacteria bacterium]|nr:FKBP-type peptidyl-prolyl cis-trans isomerase [Gammaproteobacteria bacterium]
MKVNKGILAALGLLPALVLAEAAAPVVQPAPAQQASAPTTRQNSSQEHAKRGDEFVTQGNFPAALKEFDTAIKLDPEAKTLYVKKGIVLYNSRRADEAIPLMDKAIQLSRDDRKWTWWPLYHKAIAQARNRDFEGAIKSLDESIKLNPNYENYFARGMAYNVQQQAAKALEDIRAALSLDSSDQRVVQWAADLEEQVKGEQYAADMARQKGAQKTASGLVYFELKKGAGKSPRPADTVKVHYHGTLPNGTVFDSSVQRGEPATFPLNGVIACWTEGLQKMQVGGKAKLICPAKIAYGEHGAPPAIKPGATLVFEVELLAIE